MIVVHAPHALQGLEDLKKRSGKGDRNADGVRRFDHVFDILVVDKYLSARLEIPFAHHGRLLLEHLGARKPALYGFDDLHGVRPRCGSKHERLCYGPNVHIYYYLVSELCNAARAGAAEQQAALAEHAEYRQELIVSRLIAAAHYGERAVDSPRLTPADRRVYEHNAHRAELFIAGLALHRGDGAHIAYYLAGCESAGNTVFAE